MIYDITQIILFRLAVLQLLILYSHRNPMHGSNIYDGPPYQFGIMRIGLHIWGPRRLSRYTFAKRGFDLRKLHDTSDSSSAL